MGKKAGSKVQVLIEKGKNAGKDVQRIDLCGKEYYNTRKE